VIRVFFVIGRLNVGGAEAELLRLANGLDRSRFLPYVVTLEDPGPRASELRGIELISLGRRRKWSVGTYRELRRLLRQYRPDIVQSFLFTENMFTRWIGEGAVVSGLQGSLSDDFETGPSLKLLLERSTFGRPRAVVSNSEFYRSLYGRLGLDASRIVVIPSGVEFREGKGDRIRAEFGIRPGEILITSVARLVERKGHEDLIRAGAGYRLLFVGDGPFRRRLEGRGAILAGWRTDIPDILAASDIVALASRFGEGCPNSLLEAMAQGRPVVATRAGGTPEVVIDGQTGLLVRPWDGEGLRSALGALAADPGLRQRLGRAGQERARSEFGVERLVRSYEALYFKLTAEGAQV
jgi:glycosyltransferase involved in cell wall biosynthesis